MYLFVLWSHIPSFLYIGSSSKGKVPFSSFNQIANQQTYSLFQKKWNGPSINFNYLNCPLCGVFISHPMLSMSEDMILFSDVKRKAVEKLFAEGMINDEVSFFDSILMMKISNFPIQAVTNKNGRFFGDVCGYALHVFAFYRCYYCGVAYCGGECRFNH